MNFRLKEEYDGWDIIRVKSETCCAVVYWCCLGPGGHVVDFHQGSFTPEDLEEIAGLVRGLSEDED